MTYGMGNVKNTLGSESEGRYLGQGSVFGKPVYGSGIGSV